MFGNRLMPREPRREGRRQKPDPEWYDQAEHGHQARRLALSIDRLEVDLQSRHQQEHGGSQCRESAPDERHVSRDRKQQALQLRQDRAENGRAEQDTRQKLANHGGLAKAARELAQSPRKGQQEANRKEEYTQLFGVHSITIDKAV
jgi:hypothetical protein